PRYTPQRMRDAGGFLQKIRRNYRQRIYPPKALRMTWMQRLKRVFAIEIETCQRCGGKLEVIASIEDAELIGRILEHRAQHGDDDLRGTPFAPRAPPPPSLL